ncbi:polysaccharide biosynthesis tyrosine autokinase [Oceanitalea stevensii]|uniref:non-specific protein-tyrosine kinase n=1 Tax=Oceanitalea stevensii TaxID=2763072 RepID=A0ABR8Z560_9MICO|nr:polysaccharide biosynthesis tyrosine autokinase [Oceanitalea stevensii]MBD8063399.1 polysaccharide biosynthesis tyrosine autokinase [Oceanitalea stevensii]
MDLRDYLHVLRTRWLTVVTVGLLTLAATAAGTLLTTPEYTSSTRMFFAVQGGESVSDLAQGSTFTEKQMASYAEVAKSPIVLGPVAERFGLGEDPSNLAAALDVSVAADTTILVIAATDEDPVLARDVANAVADQLASTVGGLSPERPDGTETVRATMLSEAQVADSPSSPRTARNLAMGLVLGALLGVGVALLRQLLDTKVRDDNDIAAVTDVTPLATVPVDPTATDHPVFMHDDSMGARAEAIRRLRTNLQFVDFGDRPSSIVVTSSVPGEGKTTTAINLAASLADAGARVILIDADLRRPSVAKYMGFEGRVGLTTVLIGRANVEDVVQPWQGTSLDILPSGQIPPNPSELLGSRAMSRLLGDLAGTYDVVLIDSPPLLPVTDAAILSKLVGGTLVVAGADRLQKPQLRTSLEALAKVDAHVLGIVLNKAQRKERDRYAYEYYSSEDPTLTGSRVSAARSSRRTAAPQPTHAKRSTWPGERLSASRR